MRPIALITDFGTKDPYVGSLKGVILTINPEAKIIDVTHEIIPFHPISAAYVLLGVMNYFPRGTIFLTVVDPGVGTDRKILLISSEGKYYIGPDNGIFAPVYQYAEEYTVYEVKEPHFFLPNPSSTFEARDKMAPVAAWLSKEIPVERFGERTENFRKFKLPQPRIEGNTIRGIVIHVDRFGNLALNIREEDLKGKKILFGSIKGVKISGIAKTFMDIRPNELSFIVNSMGFLEIVTRMGSASQVLKAGIGEPVELFVS